MNPPTFYPAQLLGLVEGGRCSARAAKPTTRKRQSSAALAGQRCQSGAPGAGNLTYPDRVFATSVALAAKPTTSPPGIAVGQAVDSGFIPEGERKLVTALFVDIINSTGLEQDLDPEEARAIIDPALGLMIDSVRRYDGHVVRDCPRR